jgi:hypothetical protein
VMGQDYYWRYCGGGIDAANRMTMMMQFFVEMVTWIMTKCFIQQ